MAYTGSKAVAGKGAQLAINTGTASVPVWSPVYEMASIAPSAYENKTDDSSNLNSVAAERLSTLPDGGTWDCSGNWIPTDTGQIAMAAAFASGALKSFKVTLPVAPGQTTSGDSFAFSGIVTKWSPAITGADKKIGNSCTIATSNGVTYTAGS